MSKAEVYLIVFQAIIKIAILFGACWCINKFAISLQIVTGLSVQQTRDLVWPAFSAIYLMVWFLTDDIKK